MERWTGLKIAAVTLAAGLIQADHPANHVLPEKPAIAREAANSLIAPELQQLGRELTEWKLANGQRASDLFPEVQRASQILLGEINPNSFIPFMKPPINFRLGEVLGNEMNFSSSTSDARTTIVDLPSGGGFTGNWIKDAEITLIFPRDIWESSARFPFAVIQASTINDFWNLQRLYVGQVSLQGVRFSSTNPLGIPTSDIETDLNFARIFSVYETDISGISFLATIMEMGNNIRTGAVVANWELQQTLENKPIPTALWSRQMKFNRLFLEEEGLIEKKGNIYVWRSGHAPTINTEEFVELVRKMGYRINQSNMSN